MIWVMKLFRVGYIAYDNYHDFQHINFIFSQNFIIVMVWVRSSYRSWVVYIVFNNMARPLPSNWRLWKHSIRKLLALQHEKVSVRMCFFRVEFFCLVFFFCNIMIVTNDESKQNFHYLIHQFTYGLSSIKIWIQLYYWYNW